MGSSGEQGGSPLGRLPIVVTSLCTFRSGLEEGEWGNAEEEEYPTGPVGSHLRPGP